MECKSCTKLKLYKSPVGHNYLFYNYVSVATPKCFIVMHFSLKCNSQWVELISGGAVVNRRYNFHLWP